MGTTSPPPAETIPERLRVFFQENGPDQLNLKSDANLVIQRVLEFGDWEEIRWWFALYGSRRIREFIHIYGERWLKPVSFISDAEASPMPTMLVRTSWTKIKKFLNTKAIEAGRQRLDELWQ